MKNVLLILLSCVLCFFATRYIEKTYKDHNRFIQSLGNGYLDESYTDAVKVHSVNTVYTAKVIVCLMVILTTIIIIIINFYSYLTTYHCIPKCDRYDCDE